MGRKIPPAQNHVTSREQRRLRFPLTWERSSEPTFIGRRRQFRTRQGLIRKTADNKTYPGRGIVGETCQLPLSSKTHRPFRGSCAVRVKPRFSNVAGVGFSRYLGANPEIKQTIATIGRCQSKCSILLRGGLDV